MALPIWALYMQKVYNDPSLNYSKGDFEPPLKELSVDLDCSESDKGEETENIESNVIEF